MATIQERTNGKSEKTYRVQVRLKGHPPQTATFERKTDAKKWAAKIESEMREGRHFSKIEAKRHTVKDLLQRYIEQVLPLKPRSQIKQTKQLKWWIKQIGSYILADITPTLIADCRDQLLRGITYRGKPRCGSTVNRYLAALSHAFSIGVKEWQWLDSNPVTKVRKLKESKGRVRFLDDNERARLLTACQSSDHPFLYLIVILCLSTGARKSEILNLCWEHVDLSRKVITLYHTKNGDTRVLPLGSHALSLMLMHAKIRRIDTNLVFPNLTGDKPTDIRASWELALKQAEVQEFCFHSLRHSAASYLAMNGASLAEIATILGHRSLSMVKRYTHLSESHTASVVERMNERIFGNG